MFLRLPFFSHHTFHDTRYTRGKTGKRSKARKRKVGGGFASLFISPFPPLPFPLTEIAKKKKLGRTRWLYGKDWGGGFANSRENPPISTPFCLFPFSLSLLSKSRRKDRVSNMLTLPPARCPTSPQGGRQAGPKTGSLRG